MLPQSHRNLMQMMSPALLDEAALMCTAKWLERVPFLNNTEQSFLVQVGLALTSLVYTPGEPIPRGFLYIMNKGLALQNGIVRDKNAVWGEDVILSSEKLRHKSDARALSFVEVGTSAQDFALARVRVVWETRPPHPAPHRRTPRAVPALVDS